MKFYESIGLTGVIFVLAGIAVAVLHSTGKLTTAIGGLTAWIAAQAAFTVAMLTILPRRPVTYAAPRPVLTETGQERRAKA